MPVTISLWGETIPYLDPQADTPNSMMAYLLEKEAPAPAVLVLPGGAYAGRAPHEGEPIARFYNRCGFHAFVVNYRVSPNRYPAPLADVQRAIRMVRSRSVEWGIDPSRVFVCGFSAGGHLAASAAVLEEDVSAIGDALDDVNHRPNGAILCYPVISGMDEHRHVTSHQMLLGERFEAMREEMSLQNRVNENTVPCFIWHTASDGVVPVVHSLSLADSLAKHHVPYEMHIFPVGYHGLGLATDKPEFPGVCRWGEWSAEWIRRFS